MQTSGQFFFSLSIDNDLQSLDILMKHTIHFNPFNPVPRVQKIKIRKLACTDFLWLNL